MSTIDGTNWLLKALHPNASMAEVKGIPCKNNESVVTYNNNLGDLLPIPGSISALPISTIDRNYDMNVYMTNDPVVKATAVCWDNMYSPITEKTQIHINWYDYQVPASFYIDFGQNTSFVTEKVILNSQIQGDNITEKYESLQSQGQGIKTMFNGYQFIPTMSSMYNQGTVDVTQDTFTPRIFTNSSSETRVSLPSAVDSGSPLGSHVVDNSDNGVKGVVAYEDNDFPSPASIFGNPFALTTNAKEGLYVTQKMNNVQINNFMTLENRWGITKTPFYVCGVTACYTASTASIRQIYSFTSSFNNETGRLSFTSPNNIANTRCIICFHCVSPLGIKFVIYVGTGLSDILQKPVVTTVLAKGLEMILSSNVGQYFDHSIQPSNNGSVNGSGPDLSIYSTFSTDPTYTDPTNRYVRGQINPVEVVMSTGQAGTSSNNLLISNPVTKDLIRNYLKSNTVWGNTYDGRILAKAEDGSSKLTTVFYRGLSMSARLKIIIRAGYEMTVTTKSPLIMWKHPAVGQDELAIAKYIAITNKIRDAVSGYYATTSGNGEYTEFIMGLIQGETLGQSPVASFNSGGMADFQGGGGGMRKRKRI